MSHSKLKGFVLGLLTVAMSSTLLAAAALAEARTTVRIPLGRAEVVTSEDEVKTVAIAEPKIADAAVGSARTVVVNAKEDRKSVV